jgi:hypothetical protein
MVYCFKCGKKNSNTANFCIGCGVKLLNDDIKLKKNVKKTEFSFSDLLNRTQDNLEHDKLLLEKFISDIELNIKKFGLDEVKTEEELQEQIKKIDFEIKKLKQNLDGKLKIYTSDKILIKKNRDEDNPMKITYSISLKERKKDKGREVLFKNSNNQKTKLKVFISENSIDIPDINYHSVYPVKSKNNNFLLGYNDQYFDGNHKTVDGETVFVNENELFLINELKRPNDGKIAENGNFIINDWMGSNLSGTFYAFNSDAKIIFKRKFNSNLGNTAISDNGQYAALETYHSESDDSDKIFFFDLNNKTILWERKRDLGNIKRFKFDSNMLTVFYDDNNLSYRYNFQGVLVDQDKFEKERLLYANGYELFNIAKEKMDKLDYENNDLSDYDEVLSFLERSSKENISDYTKARVYRTIGEIYYNYNKTEEALENFEKALHYGPKVGIKRLYDKLNKNK